MSYFPIFELIETSVKNLLTWFFIKFLFFTKELRTEVERYFRTGQTSFRYFEWLSFARMRSLYPRRWKALVIDFAGAYLRLGLGGAVIILACLALY